MTGLFDGFRFGEFSVNYFVNTNEFIFHEFHISIVRDIVPSIPGCRDAK